MKNIVVLFYHIVTLTQEERYMIFLKNFYRVKCIIALINKYIRSILITKFLNDFRIFNK